MESFYDLQIYQRSYKAALSIHKITKTFPKDEQFGLTAQMRRASKSIAANIAEGFAKRHNSDAEFKRFLHMSVGSANEMLVWLDFCVDLGYADKKEIHSMKDKYIELSKMIYALSQNWKKRAA